MVSRANPSASNIDSTFIFGDQFSGTSLNTTRWTPPSSGGTVAVANDVVTVTSTSAGYYAIWPQTSQNANFGTGTAMTD